MATAAFSNPEVEILPLADADPEKLEEIFDEECNEWIDLLKWDYRGSSSLIRDVARQKQLSGFAAMNGASCVGFAYYLVEGWRCSIGDVYVSKKWRGLAIDGELAGAIVDRLDAMTRIRRIESQYVGIDSHAAEAVFQNRDFDRLERNYMIVDLKEDGSGRRSSPHTDTESITIRSWRDTDFSQAARIIHRSYRGTHDSRINCQYRSEDGCADLLTILTQHLWCGDFLPQVSRVATRVSGTITGVLIGSRISKGIGHIGQISVHPAHQHRGIGRQLVESALYEYRRLGFDAVTLAVTSANIGALHLYESCGFRTIHSFPVFFREKK